MFCSAHSFDSITGSRLIVLFVVCIAGNQTGDAMGTSCSAVKTVKVNNNIVLNGGKPDTSTNGTEVNCLLSAIGTRRYNF